MAADPSVVKTVSRHGGRCFGVYADVAQPGTLRVGDAGVLCAGGSHSMLGASVGRLAERLKRNAVRTGNRLLPG